MASQTPVATSQAPKTAPGLRKPALTPLLSEQSRPGGWVKWGVLLPLLLLVVYLLGRTLEPIRARLELLPLGSRIVPAPVWQVLWNKQPQPAVLASASSVTTGAPSAVPAGELSKVEAEAAARLIAAELKESDLKKREADLIAREAALKAREVSILEQERRLGQEVRAAEGLGTRLEGQLRSEQDRVEVIRAMKNSSAQQLLAALTDDQAIRVLMYMEASEVAKLLSAMDSYRAARILLALRQVSPPSGSP